VEFINKEELKRNKEKQNNC